MPGKPYVFVSYARVDYEPVNAVVQELNAQGIDTWTDIKNLTPGEDWGAAIGRAIRETEAMLVFISPASAQSTWILNEFRMAQGEGVRILPILLHATPIKELPPWLARIQWLDMSRYPPAAAAREVAAEVVKFLTHFKSTTAPTQLPDRQRQTLAEALAAQARDQTEQPKEKDKQPPNTIFIVHGHDEEFLRDVEDFLRQSGIKPIIMKDVGGVSAS